MSKRDLRQRMKFIRSLEGEISPDPAWVLRNRSVLLAEVTRTMPQADLTLGQKIRHALQPFVLQRAFAAMKGSVLAALSVFGVVISGSLVSVSAAEKSIPGDFLFPVKIATEQTRLILTKTQTEKVKLKTEFVERRVQEMRAIVSSDMPQKPRRIKEAAEMLKRDFDTVKTQLNEASHQDPAGDVAVAAKMVDQKTTEAVTALKDVKTGLSPDARVQVSEAMAAAVNTGVKAVQVLVDSKNDPDAQGVMTDEELIHSINAKVQDIQTDITDVTQKITGTSTTSGATVPKTLTGSTSTLPTLDNASSSLTQLQSAQNSLDATKQLIQDNNLTDVGDKLLEVAKVVTTVGVSVDAALNVTTTDAFLPAATSTVTGVTSSTGLLIPGSTSTTTKTSTSSTGSPP